MAEGNIIAAPLLLILILASFSDASLFSKYRMLVQQAANPNPNSSLPVSPSTSPVVDTKKSGAHTNGPGNVNPKTSDTGGSVAPPPPHVDEKGQDPKLPNGKESTSTEKQKNGEDNKSNKDGSVKEKGLDNPKPSDSTPTGVDVGKNKASEQVGKEKQSGESGKESPSGTGESCGGVTNKCNQGSLVACIKDLDTGSKELVVQNEGEGSLSVDIILPSTGKYPLKKLNIQKHEVKKVNLADIVIKSNKLILSAGNGECVLHMDSSVSEGNFFIRLPSYDNLVTPINGAYFLIATVVIFGGTWACCKFMRRRRQDGIPYQELEMGMPESVSAAEAETAEGWDQGWDDDWDEENAVKSPSVRPVGNISANGLTSRSSNKDGWGNDWNG